MQKMACISKDLIAKKEEFYYFMESIKKMDFISKISLQKKVFLLGNLLRKWLV